MNSSLRFLSVLCMVAVLQSEAQIIVEPMASVSICGSPTLNIAYTAGGAFNGGNVFTVELSDASGSFAAPTVIGSAAATGSGSISCSFPAGIQGGSGQAIRVVATDPAQIGDAYVLPISTVVPPNAGLSTNMSVCSNLPSFSMIGGLDGSPQFGGMWIDPMGNAHSNIFSPGVSLPGCYTYAVAASPPCANEVSTLCITVSIAPNAGTNVSFNACGGPPIDMQAGLPPGGTWTFAGAPHSNIYVPGVDAPGPYQYTLPGIPPCTGVMHTAWMMVDMPANAGSSVTVARCLSQGDVDLFAQLGGTPTAGGTWSDNASTGQLVGGAFVVAGTPSGSYSFSYTVAGGNCPDAQATVTVNLNAVCLMPPATPYPVE